jgi:hypothetical protein
MHLLVETIILSLYFQELFRNLSKQSVLQKKISFLTAGFTFLLCSIFVGYLYNLKDSPKGSQSYCNSISVPLFMVNRG